MAHTEDVGSQSSRWQGGEVEYNIPAILPRGTSANVPLHVFDIPEQRRTRCKRDLLADHCIAQHLPEIFRVT